jgi:hypothetical protein
LYVGFGITSYKVRGDSPTASIPIALAANERKEHIERQSFILTAYKILVTLEINRRPL